MYLRLQITKARNSLTNFLSSPAQHSKRSKPSRNLSLTSERKDLELAARRLIKVLPSQKLIPQLLHAPAKGKTLKNRAQYTSVYTSRYAESKLSAHIKEGHFLALGLINPSLQDGEIFTSRDFPYARTPSAAQSARNISQAGVSNHRVRAAVCLRAAVSALTFRMLDELLTAIRLGCVHIYTSWPRTELCLFV